MKSNMSIFFLKNRALSWLLLILILAGGFYSYLKMGKLEDAPFTIKQAVVTTTYPGASPLEVQQQVTDVLEESIQSLGELYYLKSENRVGLSKITVYVKKEIRADAMQQLWDKLRRKVNDVQNKLPEGADPSVVNDDFGDVLGVFYGLQGNGVSWRELEEQAKLIKNEFLSIQDVAKVEIFGVQTRTIEVNVQLSLLSQTGTTMGDIVAAFQKQNKITDAGAIETRDNRSRIETTGSFSNLDEIENLTITSRSGENFRLGDVAVLSELYRELVDVSRQYQSSVGKLVAIVQERVEAEFTDRNDLLMAEVKKNEADYQLLQAIHDADVSFLSMAVLAGLSADSVFELDSLVVPVCEATVHTGFHPENSNRAELRIATENIARQQSLMKLENSQFLPHLSVGVDGSYAAPEYDFTADMDWNYAIYAKLSIPLYEWGKRKNVRRAGNYQVCMAKENYSKVVDPIYLETETAGSAYRQAVEQVLLTEQSLEKAAESESISLDNYREGLISIVEVINAQLYHLQARVNYIQSKLKAQVSRSDYYRAIGMSF